MVSVGAVLVSNGTIPSIEYVGDVDISNSNGQSLRLVPCWLTFPFDYCLKSRIRIVNKEFCIILQRGTSLDNLRFLSRKKGKC